jgi:hypothetical protein
MQRGCSPPSKNESYLRSQFLNLCRFAPKPLKFFCCCLEQRAPASFGSARKPASPCVRHKSVASLRNRFIFFPLALTNTPCGFRLGAQAGLALYVRQKPLRPLQPLHHGMTPNRANRIGTMHLVPSSCCCRMVPTTSVNWNPRCCLFPHVDFSSCRAYRKLSQAGGVAGSAEPAPCRS